MGMKEAVWTKLMFFTFLSFGSIVDYKQPKLTSYNDINLIYFLLNDHGMMLSQAQVYSLGIEPIGQSGGFRQAQVQVFGSIERPARQLIAAILHSHMQVSRFTIWPIGQVMSEGSQGARH